MIMAIEGICIGGPLDGQHRELKEGNRLYAPQASLYQPMLAPFEYRAEDIDVAGKLFHLFIPIDWSMEAAIQWLLNDYARRRR